VFSGIAYWFSIGADSRAWADLQTALLSSGITLGIFAVYHLIRVPFFVHADTVVGDPNMPVPGKAYGIFGVLLLLGMVVGAGVLGKQVYAALPKATVEIVIKTPPAPRIELPDRGKSSVDDPDLESRVRNPRQAEAIRGVLFTHNQPGKVNYFEYVTGDQEAKDLRDQLVDILRSGRWTIGSVESEPGDFHGMKVIINYRDKLPDFYVYLKEAFIKGGLDVDWIENKTPNAPDEASISMIQIGHR